MPETDMPIIQTDKEIHERFTVNIVEIQNSNDTIKSDFLTVLVVSTYICVLKKTIDKYVFLESVFML